MKRYQNGCITGQEFVTGRIYKMRISCPDIAADAAPGQFISIYPDRGDIILPRPISICDADRKKGELTFMYHIAGKGTDYMSALQAGKELKIAGPMGNGFILGGFKKLALIGGGIGSPPMFFAAREVKEKMPQTEVAVYLSFRNKDLVILEKEFESIGVKLFVATSDGSYGYKGNALNCLTDSGFMADAIFSCGPYGMLKAVAETAEKMGASCQLSMEERMGCSIGACSGCAIPIVADNEKGFAYKKVCKDGPVFNAKEVFWK